MHHPAVYWGAWGHRPQRVDRLVKKELDDERQKFTEAAVKLGKQRSAFESDRIKFLEEKRSWQVQQMLPELPPTPMLDTTSPPPLAAHLPQLKKSRSSSRKSKVVGKLTSGRKARASRRSSIFSIPPPTNVEPAYETEVIPIVVPARERHLKDPLTSAKSILPTSFVLPPPSPRTSLPPPDTLLGPLDTPTPESDSDDTDSSSPSAPDTSFPTLLSGLISGFCLG
ncbi:hypothetical protein PAXRUDRAFT_9555 [Paxillus rubicundulus Ve08.2h10]|uniref:Uncharacterized protein n=1 Tax=Paxillus rubicundulus Ve08.2h10 TaxID=930991 RepID=A0A0D0E8E9_9AGAM|nr:hypothetical protein PAXRUDRAFT_9555 [Paxillus rubicundulus Ve08.2h10]